MSPEWHLCNKPMAEYPSCMVHLPIVMGSYYVDIGIIDGFICIDLMEEIRHG